jgi:dihydrolipoamide dehydrogenase
LPDERAPYDLVVIGSGPGGYVAAARAAQLGLRVAVVEKDAKLGGTCLHRGCIPTKALLHTAALLNEIRRAEERGIVVAKASLDVARAQAHKDAVVARLAKGVEGLMKRRKVDTFAGTGSLADARTVVVAGAKGESTRLAAKNVLLATGSVPRSVPGLAVDGERIVTSDEILRLTKVPASLLIVGAGAVGVEFATIFASFGAKVTVVEMLATAVPIEDVEVGRELARAFKKRGIDVRTGTRVERVDGGAKGALRVTLASEGGKPEEIFVEMVLVAVGRRPVSEGLNLERTRVAVEKGFVKVDAACRTAEPGVFAIGDLVPTPQLAHVASHEGMRVVEMIAGRGLHPVNYERIPSATYSEPEVASVGLTEAQARARGHDVRVGKFSFLANSKASILGESDGFVKIVSEARYGEVLGVHIVGPRATEMIAEGVALLGLEATAIETAHLVHPHPTLSEAMMEAAEAVYGAAIHG